jgi:hypothetical protein
MSKFIYLKISEIHSENVIERYGQLFSEFKESNSRVVMGYYAIFMIRRLALAISMNLFKEFPIAQISIISVMCWIVVIYLIIYRPYLKKSNNLIQIIVEICVAVSYTVAGLLINDNTNKEIIGWTIFISANLSYIIQLISIIFPVLKKLYLKIKARRERRRKSIPLNNKIADIRRNIQVKTNTMEVLQD